jgi:hypothetical protein
VVQESGVKLHQLLRDAKKVKSIELEFDETALDAWLGPDTELPGSGPDTELPGSPEVTLPLHGRIGEVTGKSALFLLCEALRSGVYQLRKLYP